MSGVFTIPMALDAGLTRSAIRHRQRLGAWTRAAGASFVRGDTVTEWQRCVGAALTWRDGVIGVRSAARLHGMPVRDDGEVHVLVPDGRRSDRAIHAYRIAVTPDEVERRGPVRMTTHRRTIADCLARLPADEARELLAWVRTRELISCEELAEEVRSRKARSGTAQLRRLHRAAVEGALSEGERRLHTVLRRAGLDGWRADVPITVDGRIVARADVLFEVERVVVEFDGRRYHGDFQKERERLNALALAGYVVLRFTWEDVTERPTEVEEQIRGALALRFPMPAAERRIG